MASRTRGRYRQNPNRVISLDQLTNLRASYLFAIAQGWRFDDFITLNFGLSDYSERMSEGFDIIRDAAVRWFRYEAACGRMPRGEGFAFIWALEQKGDWPHVHWLVHLPDELRGRFFDELPKWIRRGAGIVSAGFYHRRAADRQAIHYLTKGCDPRHFIGSPSWRTSPGGQGEFQVKRAGTSLNIAPAARKAAGWPA